MKMFKIRHLAITPQLTNSGCLVVRHVVIKSVYHKDRQNSLTALRLGLEKL